MFERYAPAVAYPTMAHLCQMRPISLAGKPPPPGFFKKVEPPIQSARWLYKTIVSGNESGGRQLICAESGGRRHRHRRRGRAFVAEMRGVLRPR